MERLSKMSSKREVWVDYVKVFACILVVLGHFFQSMVKASILPDNSIYHWFNTTIYYFHVPLFFICSGYLYQRYSKVDKWESWKKNIIKKAVTLGIPFFAFSFATWMLKTVFAGSVNNEIGGIIDTLFIHPTSPYWYLYTLFFIFLVTPTIRNRIGMTILVGISLLLKFFSTIGGDTTPFQIFAIKSLCLNEIWFVIGMTLAMAGISCINRRVVGIILSVAFISASFFTYRVDNGFLAFGMGLVACVAVLMITIPTKEYRCLNWLAGYTMPIFLMHTLFAAPTRIALIKIGIGSAIIHVLIGITISLMGPVLAMIVLNKAGLSWIVYPIRLKCLRNGKKQWK